MPKWLNAKTRRIVYVAGLAIALAVSFATNLLDGGRVAEAAQQASNTILAIVSILAALNVTPD